MIAIIMFILLWFGREFGISANFRVMCAADGAGDHVFRLWFAIELVAVGARVHHVDPRWHFVARKL